MYFKESRAQIRSEQGHKIRFVESGAKAPALYNGDARGDQGGNGGPLMQKARQAASRQHHCISRIGLLKVIFALGKGGLCNPRAPNSMM